MEREGARSRSYEPSYGPCSAPVERQQTPAERADDATVICSRDVEALSNGIDAVRQAQHRNDPAAWNEAVAQLRHRMSWAERSLDRARAQLGDASTSGKDHVAVAERALSVCKTDLATFTEAPRGWSPVSCEADILSVMRAPVTGNARSGFAQKEAALTATLSTLSVAESRSLLERLRRGWPGDPLAEEFGRMASDRKDRVLAFLTGARRREALARSKTHQEGSQRIPDRMRGELETATGRSLEHVRIHADAHGNATADQHGARAVAIGAEIYLGQGQLDPTSDDDRELLAHEVAHVVQAEVPRVSAKRDGSANDSSDAAEADADRFAARFRARGASARWTPSSRVTAGTPMCAPAVARAPAESVSNDQASATSDVAFAYLRANEANFVAVIATRLGTLRLPPHERLAWIPMGLATRFHDALYATIGADPLYMRLPELLHPADPWYVIDLHRVLTEGTAGTLIDGREPRGPLNWTALAGNALSIDVATRMDESLARMIPRYAVQLDAKRPAKVMADDLIGSHPIDRITARLLCDDQVVKPIGGGHAGKHTHSPAAPGAFRDGVRFLNDYHWLGSTDPSLWNWIEVKEPRDATIEEVAATLWLDPGESQRAYGITASPPFFRVDPGWARKLLGANAPAPSGVDEPHKDNALALASSALATEAAVAQAAGERKLDKRGLPMPADLEHLQTVLDRSFRQLERIKADLAPWKLWDLVVPAMNWVSAHRDHLDAIPENRRIELTPAIDGQQEILFEAAGAISEIAATTGATAGAETAEGAITSVLRDYAIAAGESHLIETARQALGRARGSKGQLSIALLERSAQDTQASVNELREKETLMHWGGDTADATLAGARREILQLRAKQASGQAVDPDDVDLLSAELKDQATDARAKSWYLNLHNLREEARDANFGGFETLASALGSDVRGLPNVLNDFVVELQATVISPYAPSKAAKLKEAGSERKSARAWALREAARIGDTALEEFLKLHRIRESFVGWLDAIQHQRTRTAVVSIATHLAVLIGTSVVGGVAGTAVSGAVRGALLADAAEATVGMLWAARIASTAGAVVGVATDAAINATVQTAMSDGSFKNAFIDNFLATGAVRVALAPLHKVAAAYGGAEKDLQNLSLWQRGLDRGKTVLRAGAVLTAEMITGAAVDYVVHRVRYGEKPDEKTAMEWALQGASMAIGSFVGKWVHGFQSRLGQLLEHGPQLRRRATKAKALSEQVARTGDKDAAMQLLVERHEALDEEAKAIHALMTEGKISAQTAGTLEAGNRSEMTAVTEASFATMPLRLAGLTPDDARGKVWSGATEDIAIALDQAHRAGLRVDVLAHDTAARQWKIRYNDEELTIVETGLAGRPRAAKADVSDSDRRHAARYAESAEFLQEQWEARTKDDIDKRAVIEVDHLQVGYAFAGVVNQSTLPASGEGLDDKLVVYDHKGTLSNRGAQELGQPPEKFDAPGVRTTEQAPHDAKWAKSKDLGGAIDTGRLETQTPAYRGHAVDLQARPKGPLTADASDANAWKAPNRAFRIKIRDQAGAERWFYCDRFDNVGGLGSASLRDAAKVIDSEHMEAMLAGPKPQLLRGDDPDYATKVKVGRVLVWGGTATGAWAAEPVVHPAESDVTVLGDTREPPDWPSLRREYEEINYKIAAHPGDQVPADDALRKKQIEVQIAKAHRGMAIPRNRKPGATYDKPVTGRGEHDVHIEFGTPTKIEPMPDGRVVVTVGNGENARASIYDQVVIAHGPDPSQPGAPGGLLGRGARGEDDVPVGTIALRPIYGPKRGDAAREILGLESIDPPGIQLKGAAFASKRMSPWVEKSERAQFEAEIDAMAKAHAPTRDYGEISENSNGVSPGMEVQRDRLPRANEVLAAKAFRLPGPDHTLELDPAHRENWDDQVREFFTINLRANGKWVRVQRLGGGKSGAIIYRVWLEANDVGVFKLFNRKGEATKEREVLRMLKDAHLKHMTPVNERGQIGVKRETGLDGGLLMDVAKGTSVKDLLEAVPTDPALRNEHMKQLRFAVSRVALGLAEMHVKFESGRMMTTEAKLSDANYFLDKNFRKGSDVVQMKAALGEDDFTRVKERLEGPTLDAFVAANVPATAYHGDANAGNFLVEEYNKNTGYKNLAVIDVGSMYWSVENGKGTKTGAADVARFLGSLESLAPGALNASELQSLQAEFARVYFAYDRNRTIDRASYTAAEKWYRIEMEVAAVKNDARAKQRILTILELTP